MIVAIAAIRARLAHRDPRRRASAGRLRSCCSVTIAAFLLIGVPLAVPGQADRRVLPTPRRPRRPVRRRRPRLEAAAHDHPAGRQLPGAARARARAAAARHGRRQRRRPAGALRRGRRGARPVIVFIVGDRLRAAHGRTRPCSLGLSRSLARLPRVASLVARGAAVAQADRGDYRTRRRRPPPVRTGRRARAPSSRALVILRRRRDRLGGRDGSCCRRSRSATVLRTAIEQPFDPRDYASPLAGFRRYLQRRPTDDARHAHRDRPARRARASASRPSTPTTASSTRSAATQSTSESGVVHPRALPRSTSLDVSRATRSSIDVTVGDYTGVWLPTVGKFESVDFQGDATPRRSTDSFYYNDTSGTAAVIGGLARGRPLPPRRRAARPADTGRTGSRRRRARRRSRALGRARPSSPRRSTATSTGVERPGRSSSADARRAARRAATSATASPTTSRRAAPATRPTASPSCSTDQRMIGDAEQYAVAAALMARELGLPGARRLRLRPRTPRRGRGTDDVHGSDVTAWIEVNTAQYGWVAIDPTPPVREIPEEPSPRTRQPSRVRSRSCRRPSTEPPTRDTTRRRRTPRQQDRCGRRRLGCSAARCALVGWIARSCSGCSSRRSSSIVAAKLRRRACAGAAPPHRSSGSAAAGTSSRTSSSTTASPRRAGHPQRGRAHRGRPAVRGARRGRRPRGLLARRARPTPMPTASGGRCANCRGRSTPG